MQVNGDGDLSREEFQEALPKIVALMEEEEVTVRARDRAGALGVFSIVLSVFYGVISVLRLF